MKGLHGSLNWTRLIGLFFVCFFVYIFCLIPCRRRGLSLTSLKAVHGYHHKSTTVVKICWKCRVLSLEWKSEKVMYAESNDDDKDCLTSEWCGESNEYTWLVDPSTVCTIMDLPSNYTVQQKIATFYFCNNCQTVSYFDNCWQPDIDMNL